jgi:hypothetical protein
MKGIVLLIALGVLSSMPALFLDWGWIFPVIGWTGVARVLYQALYLAAEEKLDLDAGVEPYQEPGMNLANNIKNLL